jgi:hypothetical protein
VVQPGGEHEEALDSRPARRLRRTCSGNQEPDDNTDDGAALASAGHGSDEDYGDFPESAPPTAKGERMVKHIKKGYANDGKITDKERALLMQQHGSNTTKIKMNQSIIQEKT